MLVYIEIKKSLKIYLPLSRSKVFGCLSLICVPLLILRMPSCTNFEKFTLEFSRTPETLGNASQFFLRPLFMSLDFFLLSFPLSFVVSRLFFGCVFILFCCDLSSKPYLYLYRTQMNNNR